MEEDPGVHSSKQWTTKEFPKDGNERVKFLCVHFYSSHKWKQKKSHGPVQIKPVTFSDEL